MRAFMLVDGGRKQADEPGSPPLLLAWISGAVAMWHDMDADCYLICFDLSDETALSRLQDKVRMRLIMKKALMGMRLTLRDNSGMA